MIALMSLAEERRTPLGEAIDNAPMSSRHRRFWLLAALGILLDGFDFFVIGIANPLLKHEYDLSPVMLGVVSSAAIVGAIFGAGLLGPLADRFGRRRIFRIDLWMFVVFSLACAFAPDIGFLIAFRFLVGVAIGLDYPIAASYLSEVLPKAARGRWLVGAFSLQSVGILLAAAVGLVILYAISAEVAGSATDRQIEIAWRLMLGAGAVPALIIIWLRRSTPESPRWLAQNGREKEAVEVAEALTGVPVVVTDRERERHVEQGEGLRSLFQPALFRRTMLRRTIFTAVPWFLMDIAIYGVGIFTPTLLATIFITGADASFIADDMASTAGTAVLDLFLPLGFLVAILLVDRVGRIPLQITGFLLMSVALTLLAVVDLLPGGAESHIVWVFVGFAVFNFFMNAGPNATTYALPVEVFPADMRAAGHGFAAACAKLGAALGVFLFPILLNDFGESALLFGLAGASVIALLVTAVLRIETRGRALEEISAESLSAIRPRPTPP